MKYGRSEDKSQNINFLAGVGSSTNYGPVTEHNITLYFDRVVNFQIQYGWYVPQVHHAPLLVLMHTIPSRLLCTL